MHIGLQTFLVSNTLPMMYRMMVNKQDLPLICGFRYASFAGLAISIRFVLRSCHMQMLRIQDCSHLANSSLLGNPIPPLVRPFPLGLGTGFVFPEPDVACRHSN